jgi:histidinol-phosphate aminotransferase
MKQSAKKWLSDRLAKIENIEGYSIGATCEVIANQIGIPLSEIVKLNFNENLFLPRQLQTKLVKELAEEIDLRMYPQDEEIKLREKLSGYLKISNDCIVVGNASDELIDRIVRLFVEKGDVAVSFAPTFAIPRFDVKRQGGDYVSIPLLNDLQLDVKGLLNSFTEKTRILYLCSPNNPTASQFREKDIETLAKEFPGIVVLDEAYAEFADYSFVPRIKEFENMIILRTFSKAFGLAALRLGYAVANPELAKVLTEKTPLPFPVSVFTLNMGRKMVENVEAMEKSVVLLKEERGKLIEALNQIDGVEAFDSQANFLLMSTQKGADVVDASLMQKGILIKKLGKILQYDNCFRITVGLPEMNAKLIEALKEVR